MSIEGTHATDIAETVSIGAAKRVSAPDGSAVDILAACTKGSMAKFSLGPGLVSRAVRHRTVDELWYVTNGHGRIWLSRDGSARTIDLYPGLSLSIPAGTAFQFRTEGPETLEIIGVTMPPWPGKDEAEFADGVWVT